MYSVKSQDLLFHHESQIPAKPYFSYDLGLKEHVLIHLNEKSIALKANNCKSTN